MGLHRPSLASKQPGNQVSLKVTPIQDSIFSPSTNPQEGAVPVDLMHDQDNVATDVNNNAFKIGEVEAFRGTDELLFNTLSFTHIESLRSLGSRSESAGTLWFKLHEMVTKCSIPSIPAGRMLPWHMHMWCGMETLV